MKYQFFSFHFALEILQHPKYNKCLNEIESAVESCPTYVWANKSSKNRRLDIVQQLLNTHFDRRLTIDNQWDYHPLGTGIENSGLAADFRKSFGANFSVQVEVQFGNMARWYADIFKFQAAFSRNLAHIGVSILPMQSMGRRIDSNVPTYERACRELPAAKESITLPILLVGVEPDINVIDIKRSGFSSIKNLTGAGSDKNRLRLVNGLIANPDNIANINRDSPVGPDPTNYS